ncbi:MAG: serine protease [Neomegalonema sp.]|nr:serine protease [Neomegalonema sp.]
MMRTSTHRGHGRVSRRFLLWTGPALLCLGLLSGCAGSGADGVRGNEAEKPKTTIAAPPPVEPKLAETKPAAPNAAAPSLATSSGFAMGFIGDPDGVIVTNAHAVRGCRAISVIPANQPEARIPARLITQDAARDLALLRPEQPISDTLVLSFRDVSPETSLSVLGYAGTDPLGALSVLPARLTPRAEDPAGERFALETGAVVGFSGAPVVHQDGLLAGVLAQVHDDPSAPLALAIDRRMLAVFLRQHGINFAVVRSAGDDLGQDVIVERLGGALYQVLCELG